MELNSVHVEEIWWYSSFLYLLNWVEIYEKILWAIQNLESHVMLFLYRNLHVNDDSINIWISDPFLYCDGALYMAIKLETDASIA